MTESSQGADPDDGKGPTSKRARDEADGGDDDDDGGDDNGNDDDNDQNDNDDDNDNDEVNGAAKRPPKKKFKGEPQKPASAWHIFQKEKTAQIKADEEHKATSHAEQQKMIGGWWKAASAEEKAPYEAKHTAELKAFPALYDAWKEGLDEATLKEVEMAEEKLQAWEREQSRKKREAEEAKREKEAQKAYVKLRQEQQNLEKEAQKKRKEQERLEKKAAKDKEKKDKAEKKEANKAAKDKAKAEKAAAAKAANASGPGASKKPAKAKSAYQHFSSEKRAELKDEYKEKHDEEWGKELTKEIKGRWEGLSDEDKAPYETMADQDRQRYEQEYTVWYENLDEEEMVKIQEEKAEKERAKEAAKEAKLRDRLVAKAHLLEDREDREDREAVPAPKPAKPAKSLDLKGQPDGLTKDMVVEFMQTYIPTHYLLGETLAWRELIEPELRAAHGDLDWREIPDSSRNKNTLLRSMKAIWKEIGGDSQLPTDLDEIPLEQAVAAKLAKLEAYIEKRIEIVAASKRSEKEGEAAADLAARGEIELRTKKLEKYACEACLAWWCLRTGKPSLNSLGTEAKLEQFIAGQIHKRWFPRGKPGKEDVDWEGKKQDGDRLIESKTKWKPIVPKSTQKLQAVVENGSIVWKMVDIPQDVDEAEVEKRRLEEEREAAELAKERDELQEKLRASYALQIEANLREFLKAWKSVNETKLNSEVMDAFGLAWGARTGKSADDEQLAAEDAASWWEG